MKLSFEQLMELTKMGWTKDDILKMSGGNKDEEPQKKQKHEDDKTGTETGKTEKTEKKEEPDSDSLGKYFQGLNDGILSLQKTIQESNLLRAGGKLQEPDQEAPEDILASILPSDKPKEE